MSTVVLNKIPILVTFPESFRYFFWDNRQEIGKGSFLKVRKKFTHETA